jgi:hypothetical protein
MAEHWQDDETWNHLAKIQKCPSPSEKVQIPFKFQIKPEKV